MRINIAASHRFHLLDLARELEKLGHDVRFYSYVPTKRAMQFGLKKENCHWFWWAVPFFVLDKIFPGKRFPASIRKWLMDMYLSIFMRNADILIALSGNYVKALRSAKAKGQIVILERGSKHIIEQKSILENIPNLRNKMPIPQINVIRELQGYQIADFIAVASNHVVESFEKHNYPLNKIYRNPYGVELKMFYPKNNIQKQYDIIMVGGWSYQKGCDLIVEVMKNTSFTFLHVGSIVDVEFPKLLNMKHVDAVNQTELIDFYSKAKVSVLASRQEGLAMVQAQAVACGLPLVCTKHTGGEDLKEYLPIKEQIVVMNDVDTQSLLKSIEIALGVHESNIDFSDNLKALKESLTWEAYAKRYSDFLGSINN